MQSMMRRTQMRRLAKVLCGALIAPALLVGALTAGVASAAPGYPPSTGTLTVSTTTVAPGGTDTASGSGCSAGSAVTLSLVPGGTVSTTTANLSGDFTDTVTIPSSTATGSYTLQATCIGPNGGTLSLSAAITVQTSLPFTGANVILPIGIAVVLLVIGSLALVFARRRPRHAARS
jgi:hypothetical protein